MINALTLIMLTVWKKSTCVVFLLVISRSRLVSHFYLFTNFLIFSVPFIFFSLLYIMLKGVDSGKGEGCTVKHLGGGPG